jgi:poly(A) polymerase
MQNAAAKRMNESSRFRERYLQSLTELGGKNASAQPPTPAEQLAVLVRDYLEDELDWSDEKASTWEGYTAAFALARSFVLPMNPVRVDMERAVRLIFAEHGHTVRRIHTFMEPMRRKRRTVHSGS